MRVFKNEEADRGKEGGGERGWLGQSSSEAGPSSRPFDPSFSSSSTSRPCPFGAQCQSLHPSHAAPDDTSKKRRATAARKRQADPSASTSTTSSAGLFQGPASTSPTSTPPYGGTSTAPQPYASGSSTNATYTDPSATSASPTPAWNASSTATDQQQSGTSTRSLPWTYTKATKTSSGTAAAKTSFVPGVILPLSLAGDSEDQAVYSVQMSFGHGAMASRRRRGLRDLQRRGGEEEKRRWKGKEREWDCGEVDRSLGLGWQRRKAAPETDWNGGDPQVVNLQVDLGSSDMWVAGDTCTTSDCTSAPQLFNSSASLDSGVDASLTYQSGEVDGEIFWEQVTLGNFGIGYQAFIVADTVSSEDLGGGNFTGVLGLALPANSVISDKIPGTTSSDPDGATFLDNLFGSGSSAPSNRFISLALERREDVRTTSQLGIGATSDSLCPSPCSPPYSSIVSQPQLGVTGYLHWRISLQGISATTWGDPQNGGQPTVTNITLGASQVYATKALPLAVLDSGGVQILVGTRSYADAIYGAYGISASSDGIYRMPCTTQLALTFTIAGTAYPAHPLDMSWTDPSDASQQTCVGAIQYASTLGDSGDFILGSAFLKNVYSIFQYPDVNKQATWQPTVGLVSLTNASQASKDFYAVRSLHQSLGTVSSQNGGTGVGTAPGATSDTHSAGSSAASGHKASSTAIIAAASVIGFFVFAAGLFCAWYFWLRRKFGKEGVVQYGTRASSRPMMGRRKRHQSEQSTSSLRSRKHEDMARQKSMIEGFGGEDFEGDSWLSTTEGGDSIRLGYLPSAMVAEEDEEDRAGRARMRGERGGTSSVGSSSTRGARRSSTPKPLDEERLAEDGAQAMPLLDQVSPASSPTAATTRLGGGRDVSPSGGGPAKTTSIHFAGDAPPPIPVAYAQPLPASSPPLPSSSLPASTSARSMSLAMSGPFPSPLPHAHARTTSAGARVDESSPMYDIRASDYFAVDPIPAAGRGRRASARTGRREGSAGPGGAARVSRLVEEPEEMEMRRPSS